MVFMVFLSVSLHTQLGALNLRLGGFQGFPKKSKTKTTGSRTVTLGFPQNAGKKMVASKNQPCWCRDFFGSGFLGG